MRRTFFVVCLTTICLGLGLALSFGLEKSVPTSPQMPISHHVGDEGGPKPPLPPSGDTWRDSESGLTWQVTPTGGSESWAAAKANCKSLSLADRNDWRLPTISELRTLIRGCPGTQKGGSCGVTDSCLKHKCWNGDFCGGCAPKSGTGAQGAYLPTELAGSANWYWSSSSAGKRSGAWGVNFDTGAVTAGPGASHSGEVRCVR